MQQLGQEMTAQEYGLHIALGEQEPLEPAIERAVASLIAAQANGPMTRKDKRMWHGRDFMPEHWPEIEEDALPMPATAPPTIEQIRAQARLFGMKA